MMQRLSFNLIRNGRTNFASPKGVRSLSSANYEPKCEGLQIEAKNQCLWIKLDRPKRFNALSAEMYEHLTETFNKVNEDNDVKALILTGTGDYYSSGNDLANFITAKSDPAGPEVGMTKCKNILIRFVDSLINLQKLAIAAVNGPALGIAVTTLPLFDHIIASDTATFQTPFTSLGQCPEACSSLTFPQILRPTKATELLLLNKTWDADRALSAGLISEIVPKDKLGAHLEEMVNGKFGIVNTCYPQSLKLSRSLVRDGQRQKLLEVNRKECEVILKCWLGAESNDALQKFFKRSQK